MHYLCLTYGDTVQWAGMSHPEQETVRNTCRAYETELRQRGHLVVADSFAKGAAALVSVLDGEVALQDGPLVSGAYKLVGYTMIQARDLNQVIHLAAQMPQAQLGVIEIWPLAAFDQHQQTM